MQYTNIGNYLETVSVLKFRKLVHVACANFGNPPVHVVCANGETLGNVTLSSCDTVLTLIKTRRDYTCKPVLSDYGYYTVLTIPCSPCKPHVLQYYVYWCL